jgi:hypothetical protein
MKNSLMRQTLILLIASILLGCGETPSFTERASQSSALIDGFSSYESVDDVKNFLGNAVVTVVEDSQLALSDQRPPFSILVWSISFEHLNQPGKLRLEFFNDRLMSTTFFPNEMTTYIEALNDSGITFDREGHGNNAPYTELWKSTDSNGPGFVRWADERLDEELDAWIMTYA